MNLRTILAAAALLAAVPAGATPVVAEHLEAELVAEQSAWLPGSTQWVALRLKPEAGWHTYWHNPGDSGLPTKLQWTLPEGFRAGEIAWPYPEAHALGELTNYGYDEETLHLVPIEVPPKLKGSTSATIQAQAKWLVCKDICIPGTAELELTLPVAEIATADPTWSPRFADARARLPQPGTLPGRFAIEAGELRLEVEAPEQLAGATRAGFFAYANDLVNHGAPQRVALAGASARFTQAQSAFLPGVPATVEGLLVVHGAEVRSYVVVAQPGAVEAVPASAAPPPDASHAPSAAPAPAPPGLLLVLGFALLGGLILNLMPCVFPVLSIKAVSVLEARRGDAAAERAHALAYAAGVIGSCAAVAVLLVLLRGGGELLGWGFQLQSPVFVALLAYLLLALGLSLSGVVQFGTNLMGVGQGLAEQGGYAGSFFTGVLAVVVASPCTAPFMGTALGYALAQPAPVAVLVFATLGLGLALPFLLLGFFPALGAWLPRPGRWMETFKQLMAFPLYLTVAWLLWVLGRQAGTDGVGLVLVGLVLVAFAAWLWGDPQRRAARSALALAAALAALALLAHPLVRAPAARPAAAAAVGTEPYSDARLAELRAQRRPVFVNFTADWCITCKVNEKLLERSAELKQVLAERKVAWLTADWTNPDPAITAALARFGRSGVPLYVLYPPGGEGVVLPQVLTPDIFIDALRQMPQGE
jgi:thiol:disulfide interchange protein/DsbC/DsbD-like thiol-disulfide interchange protein